jgi:hypothetical protein
LGGGPVTAGGQPVTYCLGRGRARTRARTQARARGSPGIALGNREIPRHPSTSLLGLLSVPACSRASTPLRFATRRLRRCGASFGRLQG